MDHAGVQGLARPLRRRLAARRPDRHRRPLQRGRPVRLRPFGEAVVGRPAVVAAWLTGPGRAGILGGRLRGPRRRRRRVRGPRPDPLPDRRPIGGRSRIRQHLRLPVRPRGTLPRVHRVVQPAPDRGPARLIETARAVYPLPSSRAIRTSVRGALPMPRTVRGALVQASWTGDKESMIQKHEARAHEAAKQGAQFILFQELFYGPYFCQVQDAKYYSYTELIPDGPTTKRMQDLAKQTGMVVIAPMYEEDEKASGIYYNTAAVIDSPTAATSASTARPTSPTSRASGRSSTSGPGNLGYPVFETAVGKIGVYICYDRHFPEGARALGLNGAEIVLIPSATSRGLSEYLWRVEQVSHALANGYYVGHDQPGRDRGRVRRGRLLRPELLRATRAASSSATWAPPTTRSCSCAISISTGSPRSATPGSSTATVDPTPTGTSPGPRTRYHPIRLGRLEEDGRAVSFQGGRLRPCSSASRSSPTTRSSEPWR